jgi:hypothetical protein
MERPADFEALQRPLPGASVGLALLVLLASGCVSVDYVGKSFPPTSHVDVYYSAADVKRPYTTMGEVRAQVEAIPFTNSSQQLQEKLIAEARSRGADGIVLGGLGRHQVVGPVSHTVGTSKSSKKSGGKKKKTTYTETTTTDVEDIVELRGTLIRYGE